MTDRVQVKFPLLSYRPEIGKSSPLKKFLGKPTPLNQGRQIRGAGGLAPPPMLAKSHFLPPPNMPKLGGKNFGARRQKICAGGAFLEDFGQIFEKMWLRNAIKDNFLVFQKKIPGYPSWNVYKTGF